ncbi:MAG: type I-B CRISPR-associated protein Cas7/Csh2 [Cyanobacteria bacterium]|nr:type I-B CRISPR-associated protein Cas7/Csh2 [Cyanobacteriota bacterium]
MKNSEILFIYDAILCNPNGDPDDENKPRMDYDRQRNLVSDLRLKRYIRDYLHNKGYEIFVSKIEDKIVDATKRIEILFENYVDSAGKNEKVNIRKLNKEHLDWLLKKLIDIRFFGATLPIKSETNEKSGGVATNFTGPIQFNWGYSLNPVTINPSSTITSTFAGQTTGGDTEYGSIGKDWRVFYSLIAFHGIISVIRAKKTLLSQEDINLFDDVIINCIPVEATTRSKIGQTPRLYMRVEYIDEYTFIDDFRNYLKIIPKKNDILEIRNIEDFELDISDLIELLKNERNRINKIYLWADNSIVFNNNISIENEIIKIVGKENISLLSRS